MTKNISKKWILAFIILILFILNFSLLDNGFCYNEMKFFSKRQMIDRSIFEQNVDKMTEGEKAEILKKYNIKEHPNNCIYTNNKAAGLSSVDEFFHLIRGEKIFALQCVYDRGPNEIGSDQYYMMSTGIKSCGVKGSDYFGEGISKASFIKILQNNAKFWEQQK